MIKIDTKFLNVLMQAYSRGNRTFCRHLHLLCRLLYGASHFKKYLKLKAF